jgi:hypothetical protein
MQTGRPIDSDVAVKPLILGHNKGLLQHLGNFVQWQKFMEIPAILIGNRQRNMIAIDNLHLAQPGNLRSK